MRNIILFIIIVINNNIYAQKNDYIWLTGYDSKNHSRQDSIVYGCTTGDMRFDFNYRPVNITYDSIAMYFDKTNTTYSDNDGNLLFYTNGIYVANALNLPIENSDSLNVGYIDLVWDPSIFDRGYRNSQGIICVQNMTNSNQYYLISSFLDTLANSNQSNLYCSKILITLIDMSANAGLGHVIYKNQPIIQDTLGEEIQCIRHGNGRDWWVLIQKQNSNCFYRILLDTAGFHVLPVMACIGDLMPMGQIGATLFTRWYKICLFWRLVGLKYL